MDLSSFNFVDPGTGAAAGETPTSIRSTGAYNLETALSSLTGERPQMFTPGNHAMERFKLKGNYFSEEPQYKHLFWVEILWNDVKLMKTIDGDGVSFLCKYIDLPKISLNTETLHQYNKKRIIYTGAEYEAVTMRFHTTAGRGVVHWWREYWGWYYGDGRNIDSAYLVNDVVKANISNYSYGFAPLSRGTGSANMLKEIRVYQFANKVGDWQLTRYINPKVIMIDNDSCDYTEGSVGSEVTMQFKYEMMRIDEISTAQLTDSQLRRCLLDLSHYYNIPALQAPGMLERLGGKFLSGVVENVMSGGKANASQVLKNVLKSNMPVTKSSINALKNQVYTSTLKAVGASALGAFSDLAFGGTTTSGVNRTGVDDPRITSYRYQGQSGGLRTGTGGSSAFDYLGIGSKIASGVQGNLQSENSSFLGSFGKAISSAATTANNALGGIPGNIIDGVSNAASGIYDAGSYLVTSAGNDLTNLGKDISNFISSTPEGTQMTSAGVDALNSASPDNTQYAVNVAIVNGTTVKQLQNNWSQLAVVEEKAFRLEQQGKTLDDPQLQSLYAQAQAIRAQQEEAKKSGSNNTAYTNAAFQ